MKPPSSKQRYTRLKVRQAFPLFGETLKSPTVLATRAVPVSLIDLGTEYMKLANFITEEAERLGMEKK